LTPQPTTQLRRSNGDQPLAVKFKCFYLIDAVIVVFLVFVRVLQRPVIGVTKVGLKFVLNTLIPGKNR